MKRFNRIPKTVLVGLLSLSSVVALSACSQPPAPEENVSQQPTAEAPEVASSPVMGDETATDTASPDAAASGTIVELASTNGSFNTLTKAVQAAGLTETLSGEGPFTVFAPTDEAFAALPAGTLEELLKPENKEQLAKVLKYHVVPGEVTSSQITPGEVETVAGTPVTVQVDSTSKAVKVNDAQVTQPDIKASNGVIHVVDKVILPPES